MKNQFLTLVQHLFNSVTIEELNQNRIALNNLVVNLRTTFDNVEAELKAKNLLITDINNYVDSNRDDAYRNMLLIQVRLFPDLIRE